MDIFGVLFVIVSLVPLWLIVRGLARIGHLRREDLADAGVVVRSTRAFDDVADVIGRYMGVEIYRSVVFKGVRYRYEGVAPPAFKRALRGRQLYLEPGLVYVMA